MEDINRPPSTIRKVSDNYFDEEDTQEIIFEDSSQTNQALKTPGFEMTPNDMNTRKTIKEIDPRKSKTPANRLL